MGAVDSGRVRRYFYFGFGFEFEVDNGWRIVQMQCGDSGEADS